VPALLPAMGIDELAKKGRATTLGEAIRTRGSGFRVQVDALSAIVNYPNKHSLGSVLCLIVASIVGHIVTSSTKNPKRTAGSNPPSLSSNSDGGGMTASGRTSSKAHHLLTNKIRWPSHKKTEVRE